MVQSIMDFEVVSIGICRQESSISSAIAGECLNASLSAVVCGSVVGFVSDSDVVAAAGTDAVAETSFTA